MKLIKATAECPSCDQQFHQIDGTEERALFVVRKALDKHVREQHTDTLLSIPCPACGAEQGKPCRTVIDGVDTGWTHDARVYAVMGVRTTP